MSSAEHCKDQVSKALSNAINWHAFFSLVAHVGDELNERKLRFDKSDLFEQAIAEFSGGHLVWVDEVGHDLVVAGGSRIEMKYAKGAMTTDSGRTRATVKTLKLVNTLGGGTSRVLEPTFDYLLLCDERSAALAPFESVSRFTDASADSVNLKGLPTDELTWIAPPGRFRPVRVQIEKSYKDLKRTIQRDYVMQFRTITVAGDHPTSTDSLW